MVAGCGASCVKFLFFTFNFLIFVCGGVVLGVSLWARFDNNFQNNLQNAIHQVNPDSRPIVISNMYVALYVIAAIGGLLLLCGFLGCCGACCENTCLLGLFFIIILLLFLAEVAGAIYIFVKKDSMQQELKDWFKLTFVDQAEKNEDVKKQLTEIETKLNCCGDEGCFQDIATSLSSLGKECCQKRTLAAQPTAQSCPQVIYDNLKSNVTIVAIVSVCLVIVELLAMIFSCILCNSIRNSAYAYY